MSRLVQKFGGTALADIESIRKAAELAARANQDGHDVVVVVSALGETSQQLGSLADKVNSNPSPRDLDMLMVTGEQASAALMSMAIQSLGTSARCFTAQQAGILTESRHGGATIREVCPEEIEYALERGEIAVVSGLPGAADRHEVTTIGDGGPDTTAIVLASALEAERCDVYSNDGGICTADPVIVQDARIVPAISYEEFMELALAGCSILSAEAVEMAMDNEIPIRVRPMSNHRHLGTLVTNRFRTPESTVCAVVIDLGQSALTIKSYTEPDVCLDGMSALFTRLEELGISFDMVTLINREDELAQELSFTVDRKHVKRVRAIIGSLERSLGHPYVKVDADVARMSLVGRRLLGCPEVVSQVFQTLSSSGIDTSLVAVSNLRVSLALPLAHATRAVKLIHKRFQLSEGTYMAIE